MIQILFFSELSFGYPVNDVISIGQLRYYIVPFRAGGVTVRVEVFSGEVECYVSYINRNPNSEDYNWRLFVLEYDDLYIDRISWGSTVRNFVFVAVNGTEFANNFTIISTMGDTTVRSKHHHAKISHYHTPLVILP